MPGRRMNTASTAAAAALLAALGGVLGAGAGPSALQAADSGSPKPIPLVNADDEMASYVQRAQEMIGKQDYHAAIEILQALLNRSEQCFVPTDDGHLYVSLAARASRVICDLPTKGMALYRRLYDPEADELLRRAAEDLNDPDLRDVVRRYFHTAHGDEALNLLGTVLFDRGQFSQAARCWRDILFGYRGSDLDAAALLVKIAVAHHFAGEAQRAGEAMERLRAKHAGARCRLGGKMANALAFAEKVLADRPPRFAAGPMVVSGWTSLAGAPDGLAVMSPCREPTLKPRWSRPGGSLDVNPNLKTLIGSLQHLRPVVHRGSVITRAPGAGFKLEEGHVMYTYQAGSRKQRSVLPAILHPVVVGTAVILRAAESVVAYDLLTGEKLWDTFEDFPLYRRVQLPASRHRIGYSRIGYLPGVENRGRCALTAGGDKVFAVGRFRPPLQVRSYRPGTQTAQEPDNSVLRALSLTGEGKLVWSTDEPGRPEILQACKFLSAPTYVAGRLYVVGEHMQTYHLFCLDADTGRMLWPRPAEVSQTPAGPARNYYPYNIGSLRDRGSAPAVADGRVFVCTNAGVVAGFEADTGRGLWAYQYDSSLNQPARSGRRSYHPPQPGTPTYPPNPVVVTRGRAIFLPADSERVLALRADTGEPVWKQGLDRGKQRHLTSVDEARVLLAGPGLRVVDVSSGRVVWSEGQAGRKVGSIHGRPAVTRDAILASGRGQVVIVSLADYSVVPQQLVDEKTGLLGNLVCVDGKLLAANAAGVSAYFTFEEAHRQLTARINKTPAKDRAGLLYQRGMSAFNSHRPAEALGDLRKAQALARQGKQTTLVDRIGQGLYRTYVSLANRAPSNAGMHTLLRTAEGYTYSDRSRAEMLLRMAKYQGRIGRHADAAALAQKLASEYAGTDMVAVEIGAAADPLVRDDARTLRFTGAQLGQKLIKGLIDAHGQGLYAAFDARAKADLAAAVGADNPDAMVRVVATYPHSSFAPMALLRAGESLYRKALGSPKTARTQVLSRAGQYLSRVSREYPASGLGPSAALGLAMVYREMNPRIVWLGLQGLSGVSPTTPVSFGGVSGSLGEVLKRFDSGVRHPRPASPPVLASIRPPLEKLYEVKGDSIILRGSEGRAIRAGRSVFVLNGSRLSLFDPSAGSFQSGKRWEAPLPLDAKRLYRYGFSSWSSAMLGGLSSDGSVFAMSSRAGFYGLDVRTGKLLWRRNAGESLVSGLNWMAMGEDRLVVLNSTGGVTGLDLRTGKQAFAHSVPRGDLPWRAAPQISGGLLLTIHGRTDWHATVFDLGRKRTLGTIPLARGRGQALLTPDGLVIICDGRSLRLVEPVMGMKQNIWSVRLAQNLQPVVLAATSTHVIVSPNHQSGLIELRSLAEYGRIVRSFQTRSVGGNAAVPCGARVVGGRLYVVAGMANSSSRQAVYMGRLSYVRGPSLQAFDLASGKLLWSAKLSGAGAATNLYVMPIEVCRDHVGVLVKQHYNRPSTAMLVEGRTGRAVQKVEIPGVQIKPGIRRLDHLRHMWLGGPVITDGRMLLETYAALQVYGKKARGRSP